MFCQKNFLSVFVFCLCFYSVKAQNSQNIVSKHFYSVENGLASREVFCAIQDNDGFMWFGTRNGLNRYDGKNFKLFTKQKDGLYSNRIIALAKDNFNNLFLIYGNPGFARSAMHMEVMDLKTHKIKSLRETFPNLPFDEKYLYWIANGGDDLCFLVSKPFQFWKYTNGKFELKCEMKAWDNVAGKPDDLITANGAYHTTTGFYTVFRKDYALLFLGNTESLYFITPDTVIQQTSSFDRGAVTLSPTNQLLINTSSEYGVLSNKGELKMGTSSFVPPYNSRANEIYYRRNSSKELMTYTEEGGLYLYDFDRWYKLLDKKELKIASGNSLYGFYKDRQNNFWVFTSTGLVKIKIDKNPFTHYFTKEELDDESENQVRGIAVDDSGTVYANCWNKLWKIKNKQNYSSSINKDILYGLCCSNGKVFTATNSLYEYNESSNKLNLLTDKTLGRDMWTIAPLAPDKLLLGSSGAIVNYNINTNTPVELTYSSTKFPRAIFIYRFIKRKDKTIWAVAQNGLYLLDEKGNTILDFFGKQTTDSSHKLPFDVLLDGYEDDNGIIWFVTSGEGLYRWDKAKNEFRQFNSADGLPSDILYRIESDVYNNLWISSDNGLVRFNTQDFKTNTYTTANGISHNEFNRTSSYKAADGRLFFGGLDGVNAFYPKDFVSDSTASNSPLRIISFNKFSGKYDKLIEQTNELLSQSKIVLEPGDGFFNLEFQLLDFDEGKSNYAYRIEGMDKDWNYISENSIRISGLPYGNFTLHIKGQTPRGQWSASELKIPVSVLKPFYLQWYFIFITGSVAMLSVFFFFKYRTKKLVRTKTALEKTVNERTAQLKKSLDEKEILLKEIHHRVKNNLQVISALLEMQGSRSKNEEIKAAIVEGQNRVLSIAFIHQNLYQHDDIKGVEVHSFVDELSKHIHHVFSKADCEVRVENNIPQTYLDIDTAVPLGLIINELLTNSYKYAFANKNTGTIKLELSKQKEGEYLFTYFDNGIGLPKDFDVNKATSLGLRLVRQLAKQLAGKINYSYNNVGSKFEFVLMDYITRSGL
jgi:two-component sensor histidine kinase/ligand-binding sensor domain-containing protein